MNPTHDPQLRSWLDSANEPDCDFPIQNLPFGIFRRRGSDERPRPGIAIGDQILDVPATRDMGLLYGPAADACDGPSLNPLLALSAADWSELRSQVSDLLDGDGAGRAPEFYTDDLLIPQADAELLMPVQVGDYTDFYASIHHATNIGSMFRPDNPLLPNYKWVPIGYHGRASSIVVSGEPVVRPSGQRKVPADDQPTFGPSLMLDYELEVGCVIGQGNDLGQPIALKEAERHLFGLCLLNDWSARDIQGWEYQPLGPFLAKNFVSTISPWVVTRDALEPFRTPAYERPEGDPQPLPHLTSKEDQERGGFDLTLEVLLRSEGMRKQNTPPFLLSRGGFADMYWTLAQMIAHHTSSGCNLRPGDLLGSGTVSGSAPESRGCLMERTWRGTEPIELPSGETRSFLQDGDEVTIRGYCQREGAVRIGFGSCVGIIQSGS